MQASKVYLMFLNLPMLAGNSAMPLYNGYGLIGIEHPFFDILSGVKQDR
jgi:hypothetical protein